MAANNADRPREMKFLVDLEKHTYISEKAHQEIIDLAGLQPSGYDNYLKGWVRADGTIKIWVETMEDIVFRYWEQLKLALRTLRGENLTKQQSKTYAVVNRVERFAGLVNDFMQARSKQAFFDEQMGYAVHFYGQPKVVKGSEVILLVNYRLAPHQYLLAGTRGKVLAPAGSQARKLRVKWSESSNGYKKRRPGVAMLTDRRLLSLV